jgi:hypothetical protein
VQLAGLRQGSHNHGEAGPRDCNQARARSGYETGAMSVEVSEWPITYSIFVAEKPHYSRNVLLRRQLQKNAFCLVTFIPAASRDVDGGIIVHFGGDIQVFVDARTGAVLADLRGK